MKLKKENLLELASKKDFSLPQYDIDEISKKTRENPTWVHLGAGNIFRAFLAAHQQHLLNQGFAETGIVVAEGYDDEIVDILKNYDNLTVNVTLKGDGKVEKEIIASTTDYLKMEPTSPDFDTLKEIFKKPSLQMVSMTITEKGYSLVDAKGNVVESVKKDFVNGPTHPISYLGKLVTLLYEHFKAGELPIALVSMDNMSHNGEKLQASVTAFVDAWVENQLVPSEFKSYVEEGEKVTFPWSMIDKITPRPDVTLQKMLETSGLEDMAPVQTSKHSFVAPYVNGEETEYLVIEDQFPNGRPNLEKTGIIFTNRQTVNKTETMKVTTCLNPLHTCLAIFGCLLGYTSIHEEMKDSDLVALIKTLGYKEGLPVVVNPGIIDPKAFIDEVIEKRFPNPFIPDTPQRIASDTSQKLPVRYGETMKAYLKFDTLDVKDLKVIPLVLAGWLRYLTGIDDEGKTFDVSPDPLLPSLKPLFKEFKLGQAKMTPEIKNLLKDEIIFGVNLEEIGLGEEVENLYLAMSEKPSSVRETIKKISL